MDNKSTGPAKSGSPGLAGRKVLFIIVPVTIFIVLLSGNIFLLSERAENEIMLAKLNEKLEDVNEDKASLEDDIEALKKEMCAIKAEEEVKKEKEEIFELEGLVEVRDFDATIEVNLLYASEENFTGQQLYPVEVCLLQRGTAEKLAAANDQFAKDGYRLKIWDAYRPLGVQKKLWEYMPNGIYVADPEVGSNHNRGAAVDVTLVDEKGEKLKMPTCFDVFTAEASRSYPDMPEEARNNMEYLTEVMVRNGFTTIESEWWHFNDADVGKYALQDLALEEFVNEYFSR